MREPLFCKKAVPAPSAKNSYMAGGTTNAAEGPAERGIGAHGDAPAVGRTGILPVILGSDRQRPCGRKYN